MIVKTSQKQSFLSLKNEIIKIIELYATKHPFKCSNGM